MPAITASTSSDATPASPARSRALGAAARAPAGLEEGALGGVQLVAVLGRPVERGGQAGAAVEDARVAPVGLPGAGGLAQPVLQAASLGVLVQPAAQPRPFVQQRLVRDLDRALGDRQQAALGQPRDDVVVLLGERDPAAHDRAALVLVAEAQQEPARGGLLRRVERDVGVLGEARDRALDAAAARVGRELQPPPVAPAPELEQRRREQRQRARLALDVGQQRVGQLRVHDEAGPPRRALDRAPQLLARHRPDEHVVVAERPRELRIGRAAAVEVRAHGHHDARDAAAARRRTRSARARPGRP